MNIIHILVILAGVVFSGSTSAYWQFIQRPRYFLNSSENWASAEEFCTKTVEQRVASRVPRAAQSIVVDHIDKYQYTQGQNVAICYIKETYSSGSTFVFGSTVWGYCPNPPSPTGGQVYGLPDGCYISTPACPSGYSILPTGECYPRIDENQAGNPGSCGPSAGNPIYPLTGNKRQREVLGNLGGSTISVEYDTRSKTPGSTFSVAAVPSFGPLWQSTIHRRLVPQSNSTGVIQAVQVSRGGAGWISFSRNAAGSFTPHAGVSDRLVAVSAGWQYFDAASHAVETYDSSGALTAIFRAEGGMQTYIYSTSATPADVAPSAGLLLAVQDQYGRAVQFTYEAGSAAARVRTLVDANGEITAAAYDTADNLTSLNWPDGKTRRFVYEMAALPWALTGTIDENNDRAGTYGYDPQGRAVTTERGGGVDHYSVSYGTAPAIAVSESLDTTANVVRRVHRWELAGDVVMTTPNQTSVSFGNTLVNGMPRVTTRSQPAGAGCDAASSELAYDANGNIASKTDFNGSKSCHAYDLSRNLETTRLEGLAGADACPADLAAQAIAADAVQRKTMTQWHPDWTLPVKKAEPGKITTNVYNGQPDPTAGNAVAACAPTTAVLPDGKRIVVLCKKVEQATTDTSGTLGFSAVLTGTPRTWTYTYNEHGQVLTTRDPLNHLTTYTYHAETTADFTKGDLKSVTNPALHTTQYTRYDKSGRLLESVDANGTKTETTYTPRGWVKTVTTTPSGGAPQATVYDYDGVGQLKKATLSDGTALEYTYDAAHRLRSIKDAAGNAVTYTLDNTGNRTGEELKDASGTLARNITRVYDALNRVQSATGTAQ